MCCDNILGKRSGRSWDFLEVGIFLSKVRHGRVNEGSPTRLFTDWIRYAWLTLICSASPPFGRYVYSIPLRIWGWVGLDGRLRYTHHVSTNRARHRVTSLATSPLPPLPAVVNTVWYQPNRVAWCNGLSVGLYIMIDVYIESVCALNLQTKFWFAVLERWLYS